jgi:TatD DNase family protein
MRLIDSHAHLQADAFAQDAAEVFVAARLEGVERLLSPGWDVASSRAGIAFVTGRRDAWTSAGVHPHDAASVDDAGWAEIRVLAAHPAVVAIGETGLDYDRMFSPRTAQLPNLRRHLALALETGKPLILHCRSKAGARDAQDDLIREMEDAGVDDAGWHARFGERPPAVLHSFSGPVDYAERALELGCAVSFSGLVFRPGEEASAEVARLVPAERLLVETDSPFLSPPGAPRRRNEPSWVKVTARWVAEQRGEEPETLADGFVRAFDATFGPR